MWERIQWLFGEAFHRVGSGIAKGLPGLVAMAIVVLGSIVVAFGVQSLLRWGLTRIGFDERAREWGMILEGGTEPRRKPSLLVARGTFWLVIAGGLALALAVLGASTTSALGRALLEFLPRLVVSAIVLLVGVGTARFLERTVLIGAVNQRIRQARLLAWGVKWVVIVLASAMALQHVGIGGSLPTVAFAIVAGGIVLAAALAVGLGARDTVGRALERWPEERRGDEGDEADRIHHL